VSSTVTSVPSAKYYALLPIGSGAQAIGIAINQSNNTSTTLALAIVALERC